jgi:hypothetical protein
LKRRLFNVASALSLLAFALAVALWVRSYSVQDTLSLYRARSTPTRFYKSEHRASSVRGQLLWRVSVAGMPPEFADVERRSRAKEGAKDFAYARARPDQFFFDPANPNDPWWVRLGFRYSYSLHNRASPFMMAQVLREAAVPHWLPAALAAVLPVAWVVNVWRSRHRRRESDPVGLTPPAQAKGPGDGPGPPAIQ